MESHNVSEASLSKAIQQEIKNFDDYRGKSYLLDSLLFNIEEVLKKHEQNSTELSPARKKIKRTMDSPLLSRCAHIASKSLKENSMEIQDVPAENAIFTTDVVMLKTMSFLSNSDLSLCRAVNSKWNVLALEVLNKRNTSFIYFHYDSKTGKYYKENCDPSSEFSLSNLSTFMTIRPAFPWKSFAFYLGTLCAPELQKFLDIHGAKIQDLALDVFNDREKFAESERPKLDLLRKLLVTQAPNLDSLELKKCPEEWNSSSERIFSDPDPHPVIFPKLKCIKAMYDVTTTVFCDVLHAAINLQEVLTNDEKYEEVVQGGKLHLLKTYVCALGPNIFEFYDRVVRYSQFRVETLSLDLETDEINSISDSAILAKASEIFTNVLQANQKTLKHFRLEAYIGFLPNLRFPEMAQVKILSIDLLQNPENYTKVFPVGFEFTAAFPNLVGVMVDLYEIESSALWEEYFDDFQPITTVKSLSFTNSINLPLSWMAKFSVIFPNLQTLEVNRNVNDFDFEAIRNSEGVTLFKHLKFVNYYND